MKAFRNVFALLIVMSVIGSGLTYAKQTDVRKEIERLRSPDPVERATAARVLCNIGDPRAMEPLITALKDEDIQSEAANALTTISRRNLGKDPEEWQDWWDENKETLLKGE